MKIWEENEIKILIENYHNIGPKGCKNLINNKTIRQITSKANKLGLYYNDIKNNKYNYDYFKEIIENSLNISDAARNLGLNTGRGNRKTISNYIKKYELSTNHFNNKERKTFKRYSINEILIKNSTYTNLYCLKERLYKEGLKERKCEKCGQDEWWNSEKISLILDHINGDNSDHRLENLRIVCPNCNATLPTHGGKNRKNASNA